MPTFVELCDGERPYIIARIDRWHQRDIRLDSMGWRLPIAQPPSRAKLFENCHTSIASSAGNRKSVAEIIACYHLLFTSVGRRKITVSACSHHSCKSDSAL